MPGILHQANLKTPIGNGAEGRGKATKAVGTCNPPNPPPPVETKGALRKSGRIYLVCSCLRSVGANFKLDQGVVTQILVAQLWCQQNAWPCALPALKVSTAVQYVDPKESQVKRRRPGNLTRTQESIGSLSSRSSSRGVRIWVPTFFFFCPC